MNIVDIAAGSNDFNLLVRALSAANLVTTVQDAEDITVFAPTDAAFGALARNLGFDGDITDEDAVFDAIVTALTDLNDGEPIPLLADILLYHVAPGARTEPTILGSDGIATLLDGAEIMPADGALGDGEPDLANPTIVTPDIVADNGIIQVIDNVLIPIDIPGNTPSITDIVAASGDGFDSDTSDFDMLLAAVQAAGLAETLDAEGADLTVFAPNDAAFVSTAQALGYAGADEEGAFGFLVDAATLLSAGADPIPLLTTILTYHVSPGAKDATAVLGADSLPTLAGPVLGVDGTTLVDAEPDLPNPNIIATDINASNGIVHVIDGVLIPQDVLVTDGSNAVDFLFFNDDDNAIDLGTDNDFVDAGGGDDTIVGGQGNDVIVGGEGTDTAVFANDFASYSLFLDDGIVTVRDKGGLTGGSTGEDRLNGVELLQFGDDASFVAEGAIDLSVIAGATRLDAAQVETLVELYVAYFDRAPDALGVLFWANALADGVSLREVAELFFEQPETQAKMPADLETGAFVDLAYNHVLERDADADGRAFWVEALESGGVSRAEFMLELIAGARANVAATQDVRTIEDKTDIGVFYALTLGLTNAENAETVMAAYDRDDAVESLAMAEELALEFDLLAQGAADGPEATIKIAGLIDNPFMQDQVA